MGIYECHCYMKRMIGDNGKFLCQEGEVASCCTSSSREAYKAYSSCKAQCPSQWAGMGKRVGVGPCKRLLQEGNM